MWEWGVSVGCMMMYTLWGIAVALIGLSWAIRVEPLAFLGLALSALAAALTVMRDNQRTRRLIRRAIDEGGLRTVA